MNLHPATMAVLEAGAVVVSIVFLAQYIGEEMLVAIYDAFNNFLRGRGRE